MVWRNAVPAAALLLLATLPLPATGKWELQYQHVDAEYDLRLLDIAFVDAQRGIASGFIDSRKRDRRRPVNLVTTDGKTWTLFETKKFCQDLHALTDGTVFAACEDGIYRSNELGRDWKRTAKLKNIQSIWFLTQLRGFAVGLEKGFFETSDGGKKWSAVALNPPIETSEDYTLLNSINFANPAIGMVTGWHRAPRNREPLPDWMAPERALRQRDTPHVNFIVDTRDGGATWNTQEVSMFGEVVSAKLSPDGAGLGLINFSNGFGFPAEVFFFQWPAGATRRSFREENRAVTDVALPAKGPAYLAAVEPNGKLFWSPIPGRLRMLSTTDFINWKEMEVDYRASATRCTFAAYDAENIWAITDTGMILHLLRDSAPLPARSFPPPETSTVKPGVDDAPGSEGAKPAP